jgi:geranylgeranyl transferase type-2 subunit alpha
MHGRRRQEYKDRLKDPKFSENLVKKAQQWNTLVPQLLSMSSHSTNVPQALALTEKLLLVNPDPLVLWNKRRRLLLFLASLEHEFNVKEELSLTASCLQRNPKAYGAWFHRKWILSNYATDLQKELDLTALFLKQDERNFHCWNYRSFCVGLLLGSSSSKDGSWPILDNGDMLTMGAQVVVTPTPTTTPTTTISKEECSKILSAEWDFCSQKIQDNFSNYSALHHRSKLLLLLKDVIVLSNELELVHNAIFTEPDDQTAWWYHRFLLVQAFDPSLFQLQEELQVLKELQNELVDGQSKWTWLGCHTVLVEMQKRGENVDEELDTCLNQLLVLDPDRAARYISMMMKQQKL